MIWAPGSIWKVFKVVLVGFEKFGAGSVSWDGLGQIPEGRYDRPGHAV
jgi:hypothetical protein